MMLSPFSLVMLVTGCGWFGFAFAGLSRTFFGLIRQRRLRASDPQSLCDEIKQTITRDADMAFISATADNDACVVCIFVDKTGLATTWNDSKVDQHFVGHLLLDAGKSMLDDECLESAHGGNVERVVH